MTLSRFRVHRPQLSDAGGHPASSMLGFVLGYDSLAEATESASAAPFVGTLQHDINDPGLAAAWETLAADGVASLFQTYSWQRGLVTHGLASPNGKPLYVTVRDQRRGDVVAIFPFRARIWRGVKIIDYLGAEFCDTCQPLLSRSLTLTPETTPAFVAAILSALPPADILRLQKMQSDLFGMSNPFATLAGVSASADQTFPVELTAGNAGFVAATSAYKAYQKQWRKMSRRDGITFEIFETPEAISAAFDAMIVMRNARFSDLNRDDLLDTPKVATFYRDMALLPADERVARICGLKVGESYVAYIYMLDRGGKFSTVISAMDNTVGNAYAPGLILFTKIFERAVTEGYGHGDIGIGYMFYKTRFASRPNPLFMWEKPLSLKGRIVLAALDAARSSKQWAKDNKTIRRIAEKVLRRKVKDHAPAKVEVADDE